MKFLVAFIIILSTCFIAYSVFGVRTFTQDEGSGAKSEQNINKKDMPVNMENKEYPRMRDLNKNQGEGEDGLITEDSERNMRENMQENIQEEKIPQEEIENKKEIQEKEISQEVKITEPAQNDEPEPKEKVIKPTVTGSGEYKTY